MMDNIVYLIMWGSLVLAFGALLGEAEERVHYWRRKCEEARTERDAACDTMVDMAKKLPKTKAKKPGNAFEKRLFAFGKGRKS